MNTAVTSREAILKTCRDIIAREGLEAISMRSVARACQVAIGSLYYYFPSKDDLLIAAIHSVWEHIFHAGGEAGPPLPFDEHVARLFSRVRRSTADYPHFFTMHSLSFAGADRSRARATMDSYLQGIRREMLDALRNDSAVRPNVFGDDLSEDELTDFVLSNLIFLLLRQKTDCGALLSVLRRALY